jgi:hypothetical protein
MVHSLAQGFPQDHAAAGIAGWAQVCAPSVAVAALFEREHD